MDPFSWVGDVAMNVLKSCLMVVGLLAILLIGGCMMGAYSLGSAFSKAINPTELTTTVDQSPDKVRTKLYHFLKTATNEPTAKPVTVSPYSDGSVHLSYGNAEPYDLSVIQKVMVPPVRPRPSGNHPNSPLTPVTE
jgi:hypothetical protein